MRAQFWHHEVEKGADSTGHLVAAEEGTAAPFLAPARAFRRPMRKKSRKTLTRSRPI